MLTRRIIPCLDVRDGRVVKGVRFANLHDSGDPAELAAAYESQGADEIVLLDVSATLDARRAREQTVARVREALSIPLTVGGGIQDADDARALLAAGADKVSINTAAVLRPTVIADLASEFGSQCVVIAIDAARAGASWQVVIRSGREPTGHDAIDWAREAAQRGAGEILLTSFDRDGTRSGYDLPLIAAVSSAVSIPVIASGGAAGPGDFISALAAGADAVLAASIFHFSEQTVGDVKAALANAGLEVRR